MEVTSLKKEYINQLKERMIIVLENDTTHYIRKENNMFYTEIYADYRDELCDSTIKKIFKQDCPNDYFYDHISDSYIETEIEEKDAILELLQGDDGVNNLLEKLQFDENDLRDYLHNIFYVKLPHEHYLKKNVKINIMVDTGDMNYDYVLNCVYPHYNGTKGETIDDNASILWLVKQQGYKKSQLNKALRNYDFNGSKLLESIRTEIENCSSHMNALVFCVELTLEEALKLQDRIIAEKELNKSYNPKERKGTDYITLTKETTCGLYDCWSGAGSCLEIDLEKEVKLPIKYIDSALPDGCRGSYSIDEVYCPTNIWKYGKIA